MSDPNWDDLHTPEQWAVALEDHAMTLALRYGKYDMHSDLKHAAQCIRDLAAHKTAGAELAAKVKAGIESLGKEPS